MEMPPFNHPDLDWARSLPRVAIGKRERHLNFPDSSFQYYGTDVEIRPRYCDMVKLSLSEEEASRFMTLIRAAAKVFKEHYGFTVITSNAPADPFSWEILREKQTQHKKFKSKQLHTPDAISAVEVRESKSGECKIFVPLDVVHMVFGSACAAEWARSLHDIFSDCEPYDPKRLHQKIGQLVGKLSVREKQDNEARAAKAARNGQEPQGNSQTQIELPTVQDAPQVKVEISGSKGNGRIVPPRGEQPSLFDNL